MKMTKVFTSIMIIIFNFMMFNNAYATTVASSGWNVTSQVVNGATTVFNASKTKLVNGANVVVNGVGSITPNPSQLAKFLARFGAAVVVTTVLDKLLQGTDYVMDPANNTLQYKPKTSNGLALTSQYAWYLSSIGYYASVSQACSAALAFDQKSYPSYKSVKTTQVIKSNTATCYVYDTYNNLKNIYTIGYVLNPNYDQSATNEDTKKVVLTDVAQQIIDQSETDEDARKLVNTVANTVTATNEDDQVIPARVLTDQLDATATYPSDTTAETKTETKTNEDGTTTQESTTDLPAACSWMPSVCEFASKAISFMNSDSVDSDSVETPERELDSKSFNPNMYASSSQCPADKTLSMNIVGRSYSKTFSFSDICRELSSLSNLVMAAAYAYGAIIISRDA